MSPRSHQTLNTEYINLHKSTWWFPKIGVPRNHPKIDHFSIEPSWLWGTHIFGNPQNHQLSTQVENQLGITTHQLNLSNEPDETL